MPRVCRDITFRRLSFFIAGILHGLYNTLFRFTAASFTVSAVQPRLFREPDRPFSRPSHIRDHAMALHTAANVHAKEVRLQPARCQEGSAR